MFANEGRQIFHARQVLAGRECPTHRFANRLLHRLEGCLHATELRHDAAGGQLAVLRHRARDLDANRSRERFFQKV